MEEQDETVPGFYEFSGIVTGMLLCPDLIQPLKITEELWPSPGRIWKDEAETQQFCDVLMNYWNEVNSLILYSISPITEPGETCIDVWEDDFEEEDGASPLLALRSWAAGVMRGTRLWPETCVCGHLLLLVITCCLFKNPIWIASCRSYQASSVVISAGLRGGSIRLMARA